jgi:hypothetical protein
MIAVGVAFIFFWMLVVVFKVQPDNAALVTGVVFVLVGLLLGERPWLRA